jgi:hypothetical protein
MSKSKVLWALVKFQPNLLVPEAPIVLGLVAAKWKTGGFEASIIGRTPNEQSPPRQFKSLGPLGMAQVQSWAKAMSVDIVDALKTSTDVKRAFRTLSSKWRLNVYVEDASEMPLPLGSISTIIRELASKHLPWNLDDYPMRDISDQQPADTETEWVPVFREVERARASASR